MWSFARQFAGGYSKYDEDRSQGWIYLQELLLAPPAPVQWLLLAISLLFSVIGLSRRIPFQLTRSGKLSSGCKRTFQSSSLSRIGPQEALISTHYCPNWRGWHATEQTLIWKALNNLWAPLELRAKYMNKYLNCILEAGPSSYMLWLTMRFNIVVVSAIGLQQAMDTYHQRSDHISSSMQRPPSTCPLFSEILFDRAGNTERID
ncbi:unnamed protein product [Nezara viridula]|uniref:Uncharacterized protein n=1 Tax=Nezara viridula TaxID=85310 RepID=A0A9P0MQ47_NEZVI|nr:unnamed protein product [Nezara viridula]